MDRVLVIKKKLKCFLIIILYKLLTKMDELDERLGRSMVIVIVSKEKHGTV